MAGVTNTVPRFVAPTADDLARAASIVDSAPVVSAYAAVDWDSLHEDGQIWIAAIVREAQVRAHAAIILVSTKTGGQG